MPLILASLFFAWWPSWSPDNVHLVVGDTITVTVKANRSGLADYGDSVHWIFHSVNPSVATAYLKMDGPDPRSVQITAIAPGTTYIRQQFDKTNWVQIDVACGVEAPVAAAEPMQRGRIGEPLTLALMSDIAGRTTFTWYLGETGDTSHPLDAAGPQIVFTPAAYGTQKVWVSANTACSASTAQFTIDVPYPRRHAAP